MRTLLWRHRFKLSILSLLLATSALVLLLTGNQGSALILLAVYVIVSATKEIIDWRCKPPPPALSDDEKSAIRDTRDSVDEVTAVRMLHGAHPDFGLLEATVLVRSL